VKDTHLEKSSSLTKQAQGPQCRILNSQLLRQLAFS
jgi:hypothetical protein